MEWLKKILEGAKIIDGKLDVEELVKNINTELPKHTVPKETFNNLNDQLKTANGTIADLKKNNKDNETLQQTIKDHEQTIKDKEKELAAIKKETYLKDEYRKAGVNEKYIDLLMKNSKLDDIAEVNGEFVGADKVVTASKEAYKDLFIDTENEEQENNSDSPYHYEPGNGNSSKGSVNFIDIITENQVKR